MSTEQINKEVTTDEVEQNTRAYWKEKADLLGIAYSPNLPTPKLKELVQNKLAEPTEGTKGRTYTELLAPEVQKMQDDALSLVRFKLTVLDPSKASWTGMYVTAGNDNLTPIRRAIYFIEEAWHAEKIIVEALKSMKFAHRPSAHQPRLRGTFNKHEKPKMMPAFHVQVLPPLTEQELQDLAVYQAQNGTGQMEE